MSKHTIATIIQDVLVVEGFNLSIRARGNDVEVPRNRKIECNTNATKQSPDEWTVADWIRERFPSASVAKLLVSVLRGNKQKAHGEATLGSVRASYPDVIRRLAKQGRQAKDAVASQKTEDARKLARAKRKGKLALELEKAESLAKSRVLNQNQEQIASLTSRNAKLKKDAASANPEKARKIAHDQALSALSAAITEIATLHPSVKLRCGNMMNDDDFDTNRVIDGLVRMLNLAENENANLKQQVAQLRIEQLNMLNR